MKKDEYKILVVEDNPGDVYLIREACNVSMYECHLTVVGDARAGWEALSSEAFNLVILDMGLPMEDGFHLLSRIRSDHRYDKLAVIVFSDLYGADPTRAELAGADCVIPKPPDLGSYIESLSKAVRRYATGRGNDSPGSPGGVDEAASA